MMSHVRLVVVFAAALVGLMFGPMRPQAGRAAVLDYILIKNELKLGSIHYRIEKWPVGDEQGCLAAGAAHGDHFLQRVEYVELKVFDSTNCSGKRVAQTRFWPKGAERATYIASGSALEPGAIHFTARNE